MGVGVDVVVGVGVVGVGVVVVVLGMLVVVLGIVGVGVAAKRRIRFFHGLSTETSTNTRGHVTCETIASSGLTSLAHHSSIRVLANNGKDVASGSGIGDRTPHGKLWKFLVDQ